MPEQQPAIYSANLPTKGKTYWFDVKQAKNGSKYLSITESRIKDGQKFRSTITVFADHLQDFGKAFSEAQAQVK